MISDINRPPGYISLYYNRSNESRGHSQSNYDDFRGERILFYELLFRFHFGLKITEN
jgi:hypothetical protein